MELNVTQYPKYDFCSRWESQLGNNKAEVNMNISFKKKKPHSLTKNNYNNKIKLLVLQT